MQKRKRWASARERSLAETGIVNFVRTIHERNDQCGPLRPGSQVEFGPWRRVINPVEWLAWIYGKTFVNHQAFGWFVVAVAGAGVAMILWARAVDKYNETHVPTTIVEPIDRHLAERDRAALVASLSHAPASKVGIFTLRDRSERAAFANEVAEAFREAGWTVIVNATLDQFVVDNRPGVLLVRHIQKNTPNLDLLTNAFAAARVRHEIVDVGSPQNINAIYTGDMDTGVPVVFVGPSIAPPPLR